MKQLNDLSLAALASGLGKLLSEDIGGEFDVTVQKLERTNSEVNSEKLLLNFVVKDVSHFARYMESREGQSVWGGLLNAQKANMTAEEFRHRAVRTETDSEVTYDVRSFGTEQQLGLAVFLGELVFKLGQNTLAVSKPLVLLTDESFESTEQLDGFIQTLNKGGLAVEVRPPLTDPTTGKGT